MGITIVQKSDLTEKKRKAKLALVLAGGAVTGGGFKLGGLKALDDFLVNRKTTDFDTYVGLSAGAVLAAPLAAGVSPAEMMRSLTGESEHFTPLEALDFYYPNIREFLSRPAQFAVDLLLYVPGLLTDLLRSLPKVREQYETAWQQVWHNPSLHNLELLLAPLGTLLARQRSLPSVLDYLPSGIFDNSRIERYLRENFERAGVPNHFPGLYRLTGRELYISAMNLDTAERVVFGHDEDTSLTISEAVQASTALPGFYKPARIRGVDYVDGGVRRTANIDVAIEHGAQLVICYNPFRPFHNRVRRIRENGSYRIEGTPLADLGLLTVINQVFRTLLHSRLQYGLRQYQDDPNFRGDIVVIEPKESDLHFFELSALAFWQRVAAANHGYLSVSESIEQNYDLIKQILGSYGIIMTRKQVRAGVERIREQGEETASAVLTEETPKRNLHVA